MSRDTATVLVVDNDRDLLRLAAAMLKEFRVLVADNPRDALKLAVSFQEEIHLLLSDLEMPRMSGTELARSWQEFRPETKVLLMSGSHDPPPDQGFGFIKKPFTAEQLKEKVRTMLGA